jgi:hypothetical protein
MSKFIQFTVGAADALVKALVPTGAEYLITMPSTSTVVLTAIGGVATADVITITFTTADATYQSHYAVVNAFNNAKIGISAGSAVVIPQLPLVGATQQLITSVAIG